MDYSFEGIALDVIITAIAYLITPFILFRISKREYNEQKKRKILLINSVIIALIFIIIRIIRNFEYPITSFAPALLYYYINKALWIKENTKKDLHSNVDKKKKKRSSKVLKGNKSILIIIVVMFLIITIILTFLLIKNKSTIKNQERKIEEITFDNLNYQEENKELHNKSSFLDDYIVFEIEELKGNYISYNCMKYMIKDKENIFWAYNINQAKEKGLKEYKCSIRVELGLKN